MSEMIERVARAMCVADGVDPDGDVALYGALRGYFSEPNVVYVWQTRVSVARAAIAAMREPTEEMIEGTNYPRTDWNSGTDEVWRAMIDAALGEKTS